MKNLKLTKLNERQAYAGQFSIENLLPGLRGQSIGSNLTDIDLSGVTTVELPAGTTLGGASLTALGTITSSSATALAVGLNGATGPAFNVDASTSVQASGLNVKGGTAVGTVAVSAISTGAAVQLTLDAKGTGKLKLGTVVATDVLIGSTTGMIDYQFTEITGGTGAIATATAVGAAAGGPVTAQQDGWLKMKIAGTAIWLPVWK